LADKDDLQVFYNNLATGYQRVWARYIYSAKQPATQEKRRLEMVDILSQGYKTKDLYRQGKK
ncbi:YdeI/OmpD-associated family protein, partial [Listeria monocytogenes]